MRIAFRTDASVQIGTGHVMRCLTLADELSKQGAECVFICRPHIANMFATIVERGHKIVSLPANLIKPISFTGEPVHAKWLGADWKSDANETKEALGGGVVDWLVVDHYALDERWEQALRPSCNKLMVIDDLADRGHDCDLLLDQTYGCKPNEYSPLVAEKCKLLLGAQYSLLRPEFVKLRPKALEYRNRFSAIRRIQVSVGGVDSENYTEVILKALKNIIWETPPHIEVILGRDSPNLQTIMQWSKESSMRVEVSIDVSDMAKRMVKADLAIGAAGSTSWERCCLGLPTVLIITALNQEKVGQALDNAGAVVSVSISENFQCSLVAGINKLKNRPQYLEMSRRANEICDGNGATRVAKEVLR